MSKSCKVVKVVVSEDGNRKETVKAGLTVGKAMNLRDKLDDQQTRQDLSEDQSFMDVGTRVVSYIVEGTV